MNNLFFRHWCIVMSVPNLLFARRAAVMDRYQRLKCTYPELPSSMNDFQLSCSDFWYPRKKGFYSIEASVMWWLRAFVVTWALLYFLYLHTFVAKMPLLGAFAHIMLAISLRSASSFKHPNIVFGVLVPLTFQKYSAHHVYLELWPLMYLCICVLCICKSDTREHCFWGPGIITFWKI